MAARCTWCFRVMTISACARPLLRPLLDGRRFFAVFGPRKEDDSPMAAQTARKPPSEPVRQFSVFTPNRLGRLHDLIVLFSTHEVHVLGLTVLDTTDSSILRLVVDDPDRARELLTEHKFAFTESKLI